jgi:hypothetical protein
MFLAKAAVLCASRTWVWPWPNKFWPLRQLLAPPEREGCDGALLVAVNPFDKSIVSDFTAMGLQKRLIGLTHIGTGSCWPNKSCSIRVSRRPQVLGGSMRVYCISVYFGQIRRGGGFQPLPPKLAQCANFNPSGRIEMSADFRRRLFDRLKCADHCPSRVLSSAPER